MELAKELGPYETYAGSPVRYFVVFFLVLFVDVLFSFSSRSLLVLLPSFFPFFSPQSPLPPSQASKGELQYDMWGVQPTPLHDWASLKARIAEHGLRNSLLVAPMPTASTAQILGNNESFEPYTSNIYSRRVLSGEFQVCVFVFIKKIFICCCCVVCRFLVIPAS